VSWDSEEEEWMTPIEIERAKGGYRHEKCGRPKSLGSVMEVLVMIAVLVVSTLVEGRGTGWCMKTGCATRDGLETKNITGTETQMPTIGIGIE